jgi:hypothetical protein
MSMTMNESTVSELTMLNKIDDEQGVFNGSGLELAVSTVFLLSRTARALLRLRVVTGGTT